MFFNQRNNQNFCHRNDSLLILDGIDLTLTVEQVFDWLKMKL
ncbi:hypothetical protein CWATWH0402_3941 [Crocosphaera watsonii WH 0402]|uniref:Uncharacterized protein n=1 Tax=Crocosphaera watsonii WH 0402 TaxID=1284629 RepID=T2JKH2_CROWT|nr:hypothetical protein CWATWH0402_3941 [Crocosphaera watsonii WH 0402]